VAFRLEALQADTCRGQIQVRAMGLCQSCQRGRSDEVNGDDVVDVGGKAVLLQREAVQFTAAASLGGGVCAGRQLRRVLGEEVGDIMSSLAQTTLPESHRQWETMAAELPEWNRLLQTDERLSSMEVLSLGDLSDCQAMKAIVTLSTAAQSFYACKNIKLKESPWQQTWSEVALPPAVEVPLHELHDRFKLEGMDKRSVFCAILWNSYDDRSSDSQSREARLVVSQTGTAHEANFLFALRQSEFTLSHAFQPMLRIHGGVAKHSDSEVEAGLMEILAVLSEACKEHRLLVSMSRYGGNYVNPVYFAYFGAAVGAPIRSQESGLSGAGMPSFRMLDVFFGRKSFESEMGVQQLQKSFPPSIRKMFQELEGHQDELMHYCASRPRLQALFEACLLQYMGPYGWLTSHRKRALGFVLIGMAVGRGSTNGMESTKLNSARRSVRRSSVGHGRKSTLTPAPHEILNVHFLNANEERLEPTSPASGNGAGTLSLRFERQSDQRRASIMAHTRTNSSVLKTLLASESTPLRKVTVVSRERVNKDVVELRLRATDVVFKLTPGDHVDVLPRNSKAQLAVIQAAFPEVMAMVVSSERWRHFLEGLGLEPLVAHVFEYADLRAFHIEAYAGTLRSPASGTELLKWLEETAAPLLRRQYSISSTNADLDGPCPTFILVVTQAGNGQGLCSSFLHSLQPGEDIFVCHYMKNWSLPEQGHVMVAVAGGSGISQCLALLRERAGQGMGPNHLIYVVKDEASLCYRSELEQLAQKKAVQLVIVLTRQKLEPGAASESAGRFVRGKAADVLPRLFDELVPALVANKQHGHVYVCGSTGFSNTIRGFWQKSFEQSPMIPDPVEARDWLPGLVARKLYYEEGFATPGAVPEITYSILDVIHDPDLLEWSGVVYNISTFKRCHPGGEDLFSISSFEDYLIVHGGDRMVESIRHSLAVGRIDESISEILDADILVATVVKDFRQVAMLRDRLLVATNISMADISHDLAYGIIVDHLKRLLDAVCKIVERPVHNLSARVSRWLSFAKGGPKPLKTVRVMWTKMVPALRGLSCGMVDVMYIGSTQYCSSPDRRCSAILANSMGHALRVQLEAFERELEACAKATWPLPSPQEVDTGAKEQEGGDFSAAGAGACPFMARGSVPEDGTAAGKCPFGGQADRRSECPAKPAGMVKKVLLSFRGCAQGWSA